MKLIWEQVYSTPGYFTPPGQPGDYLVKTVLAEESFYGTTQGGQRVYEYWASLNDIWKETAGQTYWVDIAWVAGQFGTDPGANVWGWHESDQHWNDDAVQTGFPNGGNPHLGPWNRLTHPDGSTVDMAFQVLTDLPEPTSVALLAVGLAGLGFTGRRKQKAM